MAVNVVKFFKLAADHVEFFRAQLARASSSQPSRQGRMRYFCAVITVLLAGSVPVLACSFNTDCEVGNQCVKSAGSIYGICAGGLFPGNNNDRQRVYTPLEIDGISNTCSFDTDCGVDDRCVKSGGSITGVCVRRR